jgi:hypothetical protein
LSLIITNHNIHNNLRPILVPMSQIIPIIKKDKALSKEEAAFNDLLLKIGMAKESLEITKSMLESKRKIAESQLRPIIDNQVAIRLKLFYIYWEAYNDKKGKKKDVVFTHFLMKEYGEIKKLGENLSEKEHAYLNSIYEELREELYGKRIEENEKAELDQLEFEERLTNFKQQQLKYGLDVDISNLSVHMSQEEFRAELNDRLNQAKQKAHFEGTGPKKSKKELKKEAEQKEIEEAKKKNVSTIFKSLAKLVHPDLERDETERIKKEEFMKKVNQAYNDHDLFTLIALEQELIADSSERLNELSEAQVKIYIKVFKEQLSEIKNNEAQLFYQPEYNFLRNYVDNAFSLKIWKPEKQVKLSTNDLKKLENTLQQLNQPKKERDALIRSIIFDFRLEQDRRYYR